MSRPLSQDFVSAMIEFGPGTSYSSFCEGPMVVGKKTATAIGTSHSLEGKINTGLTMSKV